MSTKIIVLGPTRREGCGIAEYIRQAFGTAEDVQIRELNWLGCIIAPLCRPAVLHVQFEFFLFDRFVGVSGVLFYLWLWLCSRVLLYQVVTTVHSTYDVTKLREHFPQFAKSQWAYGPARFYLSLYYRLLGVVSHRVVALTENGARNLATAGCPGAAVISVRGYTRQILPRDHGLVASGDCFVCFGFAFPNKGFDLAIRAAAELKRRGRRLRLYVISGRPAKPGIPGGGADRYLEKLQKLGIELDAPIEFSGYLANTDPLLQELALKATAFIFPYRERDVTSGALNTVLSFGRPILVSTARCFEHCSTLPHFRTGDYIDLADQMEQLVTSKGAVEAAIKAVFQIWEHDLKRPMMDDHFAIYNALLEKRNRPSKRAVAVNATAVGTRNG